jgi:excisionase family DNA binding protein
MEKALLVTADKSSQPVRVRQHRSLSRITLVTLVTFTGHHGLQTPKAAAYLGVHERAVRRWAREGAFPSAKLGNRGGFRFKREVLERFLDERRTEKAEIGQRFTCLSCVRPE